MESRHGRRRITRGSGLEPGDPRPQPRTLPKRVEYRFLSRWHGNPNSKSCVIRFSSDTWIRNFFVCFLAGSKLGGCSARRSLWMQTRARMHPRAPPHVSIPGARVRNRKRHARRANVTPPSQHHVCSLRSLVEGSHSSPSLVAAPPPAAKKPRMSAVPLASLSPLLARMRALSAAVSPL